MTSQERQEIVCVLLDRISVDGQDNSEQVNVTRHWTGDVTSQHRVIRSVDRSTQLSTFLQLLARIDTLRRDGVSVA